MSVTYEEVWNTLSQVDLNEHKESKAGLSYLSWSWAWKVLMDNFPNARYEFTKYDGIDILVYPDGTCAVECTVWIDELSRSMWLPVMDYKNHAIPSPSARSISDSKMRCLVKCIGMFGLGLYIYAGEDLPDASKEKVTDKSGWVEDELEFMQSLTNLNWTYDELVSFLKAKKMDNPHPETWTPDKRAQLLHKLRLEDPR